MTNATGSDCSIVLLSGLEFGDDVEVALDICDRSGSTRSGSSSLGIVRSYRLVYMDVQQTFEALAAALAAFLDSLAADLVLFVDAYGKG